MKKNVGAKIGPDISYLCKNAEFNLDLKVDTRLKPI